MIYTSTNQIIYNREIEAMGNGLVLLKISNSKKRTGMNYHYYYENGSKPPLDVAINPEHNFIEYISFFIQDEKINEKEEFLQNITLFKKRLSLEEPLFNDKNYHIFLKKEFDLLIEKSALAIIDCSNNENLSGYEIDNNNYILFNSSIQIAGIIMLNLNREEIHNLLDANVL